VEVFSFLRDIANDSIFEHLGRKKYHVMGTTPLNLLENVGKGLRGYNGHEIKEKARIEFLDIARRMLEKAKSVEVSNQELERIERVIDYLQKPEVFSNTTVNSKIIDELGALQLEPQVVVSFARVGVGRIIFV